MTRSFYKENSVNLLLGDAARKVDPLILNFGEAAATAFLN